MDECMEWLHDARDVFPLLDKKAITSEYKKMSPKKLGCVHAKIEQRLDFDHEALLLGESSNIRKTRAKPSEFRIFINSSLQKVGNIALRKQVVQSILMHELLHIEAEDLLTLSKEYSRRKKKKIHVKDFENEVFRRFNMLREKKGILQIEKKEHLDIALGRIMNSVRWK
ncbi:MAG: hypothetical protein QME12_06230 [Nanoarchaeota archaeon]|nr:hypothetical protein [Nanoarchaeota archaeon]